jgi:three-Cys-motif partner protein
MRSQLQFDRIGNWSEIKLEIVKKYADAYSTILSAQTKASFYHVYIDAFAGAGQHISKATEEMVPGSPLNAIDVRPPFREYHFIEIAPEKIENLKELVGPRTDVFIHEGDCNNILLSKVFPSVQYTQFRRGLCLLDPYGLHLDWEVLSVAGHMKSLDVFLNFPAQDMNRNVFWHDPEGVDEEDIRRMNRFWGDESWRNVVYETKRNLFGWPEKEPNEVIAEAFRQRLKDVAGFNQVPEPLPMKNSKGAIVYYLFFASQNETAAKIARQIFAKYREQRSR